MAEDRAPAGEERLAAEVARLEARASRLALEKSYLELVVRLMGKIGPAQGLEGTIELLLGHVLGVVGGTNITLYYRFADDLHAADALGRREKIEGIDDPLASVAYATAEAQEREEDFRETEMLTPEFSGCFTWACPLTVGSELVGVLVLERLHVGMRELYRHLRATFFPYAALVLKHQLWEESRLKRAYDSLQAANERLLEEIEERKAIEAELLELQAKLEMTVVERTAEAERANARLREAQKMEAIGRLAGGVAHDFNNILAAMMLQLGCMKDEMALDPEMLLAVDELEKGAKRAAELTRQLLMFARRTMLQRKAVDLNALVQNLLRMLRRLLGEHIRLELTASPAIPAVEADPGMIEQVIMNLAVNARDAMPSGGVLSVATSAVGGEGDGPAPSMRRPGRFACITVADSGSGIDPAVLPRIFEPFFTTKEVGQGTGLGLASVYGIIEQHRGWIEVESTLGAGSTFRVYLPATDLPVPSREAPSARPAKGRECILLVEDDAPVRASLGRFLVRCGYRVLEAGTGPEAARVWAHHRREIDLLFADMVMPEGMTGLELADRLRVDAPELPVIIHTGYAAERPERPRLVYLSKPCSPEDLAVAVRSVLT